MDINTRLDRLDGEIAELSKEIREEKTKLETAEGDRAFDLRDSIKVLNSRLEVLIADRSHLLRSSAPVPGKKPPLALCGTPSPCMRTPFHSVFVQQPPPCLSCAFQSSRCVC